MISRGFAKSFAKPLGNNCPTERINYDVEIGARWRSYLDCERYGRQTADPSSFVQREAIETTEVVIIQLNCVSNSTFGSRSNLKKLAL